MPALIDICVVILIGAAIMYWFNREKDKDLKRREDELKRKDEEIEKLKRDLNIYRGS
jgi:hypothetical protein